MPNAKSVVKALPSQMMVTPNGNVGIGTTNPQAKLHVNGDVNINNTVNTGFTQLAITAASLTAGYNSGGISGPVGGVYTYTIGNVDNNSAFTHPVVLDVGTTYEFIITASSTTGILWRIENPTFSTVSSVVTTSTLTAYSTTFIAVNATAVLRIYGSSGQTFNWNTFTVKRLDVITNGNMGIGTSVPQAKLDVRGTLQNIVNNVKCVRVMKQGFIPANTTSDITVNVTDYGFGITGVIMVEITAGVYGSAGSGAGVFKAMFAGWAGFNYLSNGASNMSLSTYVNVMAANGSFTAINNTNSVFGVRIANTIASVLSKDYVVTWTITS
jgi:hypothetical protein